MSENALRLSMTIDGVKQLDRVFTKLTEKLDDFSPVWEEIAANFYEMEKEVFKSEGAADGLRQYASLSDKYDEWKKKHYPGMKILHLTGELEESMTQKGATGNITEITPNSMKVGSSVKVGNYNLAALHQYGTKRMPAREVLRLTKKFKSNANRTIIKFLKPTNI